METLSVRARLASSARMVFEARRQARFPFLPESAIREAQQRRIGAAVAYARAHVPYYRETLRRLMLDTGDIRSADDLARLPVIEREQLQRDPEYFLSEEWPVAACHQAYTGGSFGAPVTIFRDPPSLLVEAVHRERLTSTIARLLGRQIRYREAHIAPEGSCQVRKLAAFRRISMLPSVREHRPFAMYEPPDQILAALDEYRPEVVTSYGSLLEALVAHVRDGGVWRHPPSVAVYGSDALSPAARRWARSELGIQVLSSYVSAETTHIGFECEREAGHHANVDFCPIRLIGPDGSAVPDGEPGEVVASNLVNRGTVLLNYRLGDQLTRIPRTCPCGRRLPLYSYPERAGAAWLDFGDGHRLHAQALRDVGDDDVEVRRYQIVQEAPRQILLRVVPSSGCDLDAAGERLLARLRGRVADGVTVRLEFLDDLPRTAAGKVQPVVTLVAKREFSAVPPR